MWQLNVSNNSGSNATGCWQIPRDVKRSYSVILFFFLSFLSKQISLLVTLVLERDMRYYCSGPFEKRITREGLKWCIITSDPMSTRCRVRSDEKISPWWEKINQFEGKFRYEWCLWCNTGRYMHICAVANGWYLLWRDDLPTIWSLEWTCCHNLSCSLWKFYLLMSL